VRTTTLSRGGWDAGWRAGAVPGAGVGCGAGAGGVGALAHAASDVTRNKAPSRAPCGDVMRKARMPVPGASTVVAQRNRRDYTEVTEELRGRRGLQVQRRSLLVFLCALAVPL